MRLADLSPAWRSDLIAHRLQGQVLERDDCIVLRSPSRPSHYWGNALLLPTPPQDADLAHWLQRFAAEVAVHDPAIRHVAVGVNQVPAGTAPPPAWRAAGFELTEIVTLQLRRSGLRVPSRPMSLAASLRVAEWPGDTSALVDLQCLSNPGFEPRGYRSHRQDQMGDVAALQQRDAARWFGMWQGDRVLADCGLLRDGPVGRFQHVGTAPDWRRLGLCTAMVHGVCEWAFSVWGVETLLMCAEPGEVAIHIYESLGFERLPGLVWHLQRRAPQDGGPA